MICPICSERWAYYHAHNIGNYYITYNNLYGSSNTIIYEYHESRAYIKNGSMILNGIVFLDKERIERLLLLK